MICLKNQFKCRIDFVTHPRLFFPKDKTYSCLMKMMIIMVFYVTDHFSFSHIAYVSVYFLFAFVDWRVTIIKMENIYQRYFSDIEF